MAKRARVVRRRPFAGLGLWTAEGSDPVRILASVGTLRLLDIDRERFDGASGALLERIRFEDLARLHRAANSGGHLRAFSATLRILLRDGGERRLLARGMPDPQSPGHRSLGILLEVVEDAGDAVPASAT
jgi:hypothetical protein